MARRLCPALLARGNGGLAAVGGARSAHVTLLNVERGAMNNVKPPPGWMVRLNVGMLRRGLRIGSQALLTVPGRRTGLPRRTPVSIATVGETRDIVAAFPDADWVHNARAAGSATLIRGRWAEAVRLTELPVEERGAILRAFLEQVRGGRRFFGTDDPDEVVTAADRYPVFRLE